MVVKLIRKLVSIYIIKDDYLHDESYSYLGSTNQVCTTAAAVLFALVVVILIIVVIAILIRIIYYYLKKLGRVHASKVYASNIRPTWYHIRNLYVYMSPK